MKYRSILTALVLLASVALPAADLTLDGNRYRLDGQLFDMWGIRTASATVKEEWTTQLLAQLDRYQEHGVNSVSVCYMGSSAGNVDPFSSDGKTISATYQSRMERIIEACDARGMVVVITIFYQFKASGTPKLANWTASREAVKTVARALKAHGRRNIMVNIANEQNSSAYGEKPLNRWDKVRNVSDLLDMVGDFRSQFGAGDWRIPVGAGGYDHAKNEQIGRSPLVDALLFDTDGPESSGSLFLRFVGAGVTGKPITNIEMFGGWTKQFTPQGVYPTSARNEHFREIDEAAAEPGLGVFFHSNPWCQGPSVGEPLRYDLGGMGTSSDPGIHWYFNDVRATRGLPVPAHDQGGGGGGTTPAVTRLVLYNAATDQPIGDLVPGMTIDLAVTPQIAVVAETNSYASCVRFGLDGNASLRTENTAPYAMFGDSSGNFAPWSPAPAVGQHTVTATPSSADNFGGTVGPAISVTFTIISGNPPSASPVAQASASPASGYSPLTVTFSSAGSTDDVGIVSYAWNFGDGTTGAGSTVTHTYTSPDSAVWNAVLTVTDGDGQSDTAAVAVSTSGNPPAGGAIRINFQPAGSPTVSGWTVDSGLVYGARNGQTYGWSRDLSATARDRNKASDQLLDTLVQPQASLPGATWELALPVGVYEVRLVAGDPSYYNSVYGFTLEGVTALSGTPSSANRYFDTTTRVTVSDGRLKLGNAAGSSNNKICLMEIVPVPSGSN